MDMSVWYLVGAVLVFFMQAGFAAVECGFTRAKNAGNIIMKNLMDFCIGTVVFCLLGYGIMNSENYFFGLIGRPEWQLFTDFYAFDWSNFFFQLVFCATAATIVSGAMAERTKFSSYCIYSAVISAVIYPIEAGWVWNAQGWLAQLGFIDFAGSAVIHMVGGISGLIGAIFLGPRIGKYARGRDGKLHSSAILGHNIPLAALGTFILWFCWYGFNGAAAGGAEEMARILGNTTLAPAFATVACMLFTWIKNGKPDVGMCLNAPLAGLVGITAGCASLDALGSIAVGVITGILVVLVVEFVDMKLHIDDPVGAVAVHGSCGLAGTLLTGLLAVDGGLFYGGGFRLFGVQCLGAAAIAAYTAVTMTAVFFLIQKLHGLRTSIAEEVEGLDPTEHGLPTAYADFAAAPRAYSTVGASQAPATGSADVDRAVPVVRTAPADGSTPTGISKVTIITRQNKFDDLKAAMNAIEVTGMTVTQVVGCGLQKGQTVLYRGVPVELHLLPKLQVDIVVSKVPVDTVVEAARKALYTGNIGDGKIFVYDVRDVVKVRTGETGYDALQGEE